MKKFIIILFTLLCVVPLQASAIETGDLHVTIDNLGYELNTKTKEAHVVSSGSSVPKGTTILVIPEEVEYNGMTYRVTALRDIGDIFMSILSSKIKSLYIPSSISYIGNSAFQETCSLEEIHITDLAAWCKIDFHSSPTWYARHLFLNEEEITDLVIPEGVKSISQDAFRRLYIKSVTLPEGLESIGDRTFSQCDNLTSITFPQSLKEIGYCAFTDCHGLKSVTFEGDVSSIGEHAFSACHSLSTIFIKGSIGELKNEQFSGLSQIQNVYCYAEVPPVANATTFKYSPIESATLHVPQVAIESYKESPGWEGFGNIVKIEGNPDGIEEVQEVQGSSTSEAAKPSAKVQGLYDLQGRRLQKAPEKGLYIQDGQIKMIK